MSGGKESKTDVAPVVYALIGAILIVVAIETAVLLGVVSVLGRLSKGFAEIREVVNEGGANQTAPDFSTIDMDGNRLNNATLAGRLTALLFVSTTCSSCTTTLAEMAALRHRARDGIVVVCQATKAACAGLAESLEIKGRVVADEEGRLAKLFAVESVPTAVVLESGTRIRWRGFPLREQLEAVAADG